MEDDLKASVKKESSSVKYLVSILVLMEDDLKAKPAPTTGFGCCVSILVLMEDDLKEPER